MLVILKYRHEGANRVEQIELSSVPERGMLVPIAGRPRQVSQAHWNISETALQPGEVPHVVVDLHD